MPSTDFEVHELLNISAALGERLLKSGAEIYRVEESVGCLLSTYGHPDSAVFAIPSFLVITIRDGQGQALTQTVRIRQQETDLYRVDMLNSLCRRICREKPPFSQICRQLEKIDGIGHYPLWLRIPMAGIIGCAFALFFGGSPRDGLCAVLSGTAIGAAGWFMSRFHVNLFITDVLAAAAATVLALFSVTLGLGNNADMIIAGALMNLVPGVALTNSMRDVIGGDIIAGLLKLAEALMIAFAIALGAGLALTGYVRLLEVLPVCPG